MMTKEQAEKYVSRWAEVARVQREELRAMSYEQKLQQLDDLMSWIEPLDQRGSRTAGEEQVRRTWVILRSRCGVD